MSDVVWGKKYKKRAYEMPSETIFEIENLKGEFFYSTDTDTLYYRKNNFKKWYIYCDGNSGFADDNLNHNAVTCPVNGKKRYTFLLHKFRQTVNGELSEHSVTEPNKDLFDTTRRIDKSKIKQRVYNYSVGLHE